MTKGKDFASDLQAISATVEKDVGTIMKLVREEQATEAEPPANVTVVRQPSKLDSGDDESSSAAPDAATDARIESRPRSSSTVQPKATLSEQVVLENVTTRLRRGTNELLTEAALRQRLKKETPASRQDILEAALQAWFRRHGYSR